MNELATAAAWAIIYLVSGPESANVGVRLTEGQQVPADVTGLLVPEGGVLQIEADAQVVVEGERGWFHLGEGRVRLVADGMLGVRAGDWSIVASQSEALVSRSATGDVDVCAVGSGVTARHVADSRESASSETGGDVVSDSRSGDVPTGICVRLGGEATASNRPLAPDATAAFDALTSNVGPPPAPLPDVVEDLSAQLEEVESQWSDRLDSGPQREAQSCGCSEDGGSGGGLDPTISGPPVPEPEGPDPGRLRIRIMVPRH